MTHQPYKSMSRLTHTLRLLNHRLTNAAKCLHHCMLVNQLKCITHSKRFGFLLLWYASYHGAAIKYAPAMVLHTAACNDTFMNTMSKWLTLSQVAQLPHCRLWHTASQWHNLHCPHLHCTYSPHLLHLQHWQPRWTRLWLFLPCQLFKRMPQHQCLWYPMPHLCSHKDLAMPTWHQDAWSRKSRNYWPRLSTDLVIVMHHCIHPQTIIVVAKLLCIIFSGRGMLYYHSFSLRTNPSISWLQFCGTYILSVSCFYCTWHLDLKELRCIVLVSINSCVPSKRNHPLHFTTVSWRCK